MRTTLSVEDEIYDRVIELSREKNTSVKAVINLLLLQGLKNVTQNKGSTFFTQTTFAMGSPRGNYDLNKALTYAGELEAAETKRKLDLRK